MMAVSGSSSSACTGWRRVGEEVGFDWGMDDAELPHADSLLDAEEADVGYLVQRLLPKEGDERFVIGCHCELIAALREELCLFERPCYGLGFALDRHVPGLRRVES